MASADFSIACTVEISPGKMPELSARAAGLYLMCLSVTIGFRIFQHTHRSHPASLSVRIPAVVPLLDASFDKPIQLKIGSFTMTSKRFVKEPIFN